MLTLKSSAHLSTNRHRASFRGCPSSTGVPAWRVEAARHLQEWIGLANRESRRSWLDQLWSAHCRRLAGGLPSRRPQGGHPAQRAPYGAAAMPSGSGRRSNRR